MTVITESLIRKRAEHNEGMVYTLEEVALHQQNIEKIEQLGKLCPHLKIVYLQNNLISKIQNLHKLKALEYLNLAVNNITKIQNLQRCESLQKLDLTVNFIPKAGLLTIASLQPNYNLKELILMGNPCVDWHGYRQYVVATLPHLKRLDGHDIKPSERIAAQQVLGTLQQQLHEELRAEGVDPLTASEVEDDSLVYDENGDVKETGYMDEKGEMRRPWCAATRILEHREMEAMNKEAEDKKKAASRKDPLDTPSTPTSREGFPEIKDGERVFQKNEGKWDFCLLESDDGKSVQLDVPVGRYLDTSLIKADLQPTYVRLLIKGSLLQLVLPCEVRPDDSTAQRSSTTGHLLLTMPKESPGQQVHDEAHTRSQGQEVKGSRVHGSRAQGSPTLLKLRGTKQIPPAARKGASIYNIVPATGEASDFGIREVRKASVQAAVGDDDDDDYIPAL